MDLMITPAVTDTEINEPRRNGPSTKKIAGIPRLIVEE